MFLSRKRHALVGIDIHPHVIYLVQFHQHHQRIRLAKAAYAVIPEGQTQQAVLQQLIIEQQLTGYPAALALPLQQTLAKRVNSTLLSVDQRLPQLFPGLHTSLCFDYVVQPNRQQDMLIVAAKLELLNHYTQLGETAGLNVKVIDIDTYAVARATQRFAMGSNASACVLHHAAGVVQIIILQQHEIIFTDYFPVITPSLAQKVQQALQHCELAPDHSILLSGEPFATGENDLADRQTIALNPFSTVPENTTFHSIAARFMVCAGLALRVTPRW